MGSFRAPGRVNLMGDHTDYQEGWCLPVAIDREVVVTARSRDDGRVVAHSATESGAANLAADGSDNPLTTAPTWARYVAGVLQVLAEMGRAPTGADLVFASTLPAGSGLSSSAALEVATALALADVGAFDLSGTALAVACQRAEHIAAGVPCGVLDQMASVHGRAGHALVLDCRSLTVERVAVPDDLAILTVHCGAPRRLADSDYAARRHACEVAATRAGVPTLRDATLEQVRDDPVARHVVSENTRVLAMRDALRAGDRNALGETMAASHASLRDDFRVSTPMLDELVTALVDAGAIGARLTGAGFGGCVVALAEVAVVDDVAVRAVTRYKSRTGHAADAFVCRASDGAGPC